MDLRVAVLALSAALTLPALAQQEAPPAAPSETAAPAPAETTTEENPMVILKTSKGDVKIELYPAKAPDTVANFLKYVDDGFYNGTIFHRVINGFMIQGGGFTRNMQQKATRAPVKNEAANGLKNDRGTIAMARTGDPHSATAQFFINVVDNGFLNFTSPDPRGYGYCVFGKVVSGMEAVDAIKVVATGSQDVPVETVEILQAVRAPAP
jgi:peptidyl-prolyl cis-trans isomerase B (cyclophilin B)